MSFTVRTMALDDVAGAVELQRACFPPPFKEDLLWNADHLRRHIEVFTVGQLVAIQDDRVIGSASSLIIGEENFKAHANWDTTVGGPFLNAHDPQGTTLYGVDISVHPSHRKGGVGRAMYERRFELVRELRLKRYGTACRLPGYSAWADGQGGTVESYVKLVAEGAITDRTLSPLLRMGLSLRGVVHDYMEDTESGNAAAVLEWTP